MSGWRIQLYDCVSNETSPCIWFSMWMTYWSLQNWHLAHKVQKYYRKVFKKVVYILHSFVLHLTLITSNADVTNEVNALMYVPLSCLRLLNIQEAPAGSSAASRFHPSAFYFDCSFSISYSWLQVEYIFVPLSDPWILLEKIDLLPS